MAGLGAIGAIASIAGTVVSAVGTIVGGQQQAAAAQAQAQAQAQYAQQQAQATQVMNEYQAKQYEQQAKTEQAVAQRTAEQTTKRKRLALSRLQAVSAGSGFTATDPTALALAGDIEKYGTFQSQTEQYGGAQRASVLTAEAGAKRAAGQYAVQSGDLAANYALASGNAAASSAKTSSLFNAAGTIFSGVSSFASKYATPYMNPYGGFTPYQTAGGPLVINRYG